MRTSFAIMALLGAASAIKFSPVDPEYYAATAAELNLDNQILHKHRHHHRRAHVRPAKDAYDLDPNTVSVYDDMKQHSRIPAEDKKAHTEQKEKYGAQRIHGDARAQVSAGHRHHHAHHHQNKDAYDFDKHTTSEFDDASNINGGSPYLKAIADAPQGPDLKTLETKIADKLAAHKAAKNKAPSEDTPSARDADGAREGFAGAIARDAAGKPQYDQHGASDKQIAQQEEAEAEKAAAKAAAKADAEADKVADAAVADEEKKAEAKDASEKAAKAPVDPSELNKKAEVADAAKPNVDVVASEAAEVPQKEE